MQSVIKKTIGQLFPILLAGCLCAALIPKVAYAYVDPSVMTYTIQALAGVAVALSTVIGVAARRAKKSIYKAFNIDENKGKLVEPNVSRCEPNDKKHTDKKACASGSFGALVHESPDSKYKPSRWYKRIIPAFLVATFATATLLLVAPYEIVAANSSSLLFGLDDVWVPIAIAFGVVDFIFIVALLLFRGKAFKIACGVVFAFGLCCYLQALLLNGALPAANGVPVDWSQYTTITVVSAALWIVVFAVVIVFCVKSSWKLQRALPFIAAAMIFIQGVGVASLFIDDPTLSAEERAQSKPQDELVVTDDGLFDLEPANNVVVFVLDTVDTDHVNKLLKNNPEYFTEMTDFTYFNDVTGSMIPTRYGAGFLYTGQMPHKDEDFLTYWNERFSRSTFIEDIYNQDYSIGLYTDSIYNGTDDIAGYTENIHPLSETPTIDSPENIVKTLWKCSMYRDMTWALKPPFWFYTEEVNDSMTVKERGWETSRAYRMNDILYYQDLTERGLKIKDDGKRGAFRFIHMLGSHFPYIMDENCKAVAQEHNNLDKQTLGTFRIVDTYLKNMKDLGVYDNSTVIITADHGYWDFGPDLKQLNRATSPVMFVKPANPENPGKPLVTSSVPITHGHFHPTVIEAVGGDVSKYGTPALDEVDNNNPRYYYMTVHDGKNDNTIKEYEIDGVATNFKNWHLTGFEWELNIPEVDLPRK